MNRGDMWRDLLGVIGAAALTCLPLSLLAFGVSDNAIADETTSSRTATAPPAALIARGRYLVKISGCNDCHTPGYGPNAGAVSESEWLIGDRLGFQGPWGTTYPANLRRLIQALTVEQWLHLARQPTRPPMPWFLLRDMTDQDLTAIYHFVRSLGPSQHTPPAFVPPGQGTRHGSG